MPVKKNCSSNQRSVTVHQSKGQRLAITVKLSQGAAATFVIRDSLKRDVLTSKDPHTNFVWSRVWPSVPGDAPADRKSVTQVVSFTFIGAIRYQLQLEHVKADGSRTVIKDCTYERQTQTDDTFDKWTIQYD